MPSHKRTSHDEYINSLDWVKKEKIIQLKSIIKSTIGEAEEVISYNTPAFRKDGVLTFYFAAFAKHISLSFYPTEETYKVFEHELQEYTHSKSVIQFSLDKKLPEELIRNIITDALPRILTARAKKN